MEGPCHICIDIEFVFLGQPKHWTPDCLRETGTDPQTNLQYATAARGTGWRWAEDGIYSGGPLSLACMYVPTCSLKYSITPIGPFNPIHFLPIRSAPPNLRPLSLLHRIINHRNLATEVV
ncbi:hypothetical protein H0G86_004223 [Trichoderma simmonsii]|uniref:Uncharacterized protein n=1 Tax=Trichoderma simmonsii TaxID=1491479 RepID=A0A8G0L986_9HYPO|nr:hypothetical protein H0G86_004223 [Trichoderma simmonsii]